MRTAKIIARAVLFFLWCAMVVPLQMLVLLFHRGQAAYLIPFLWQKGVCRIFGLRVIVEGLPLSAQQTLFICNHVSYLDIPVIGSVLKASFVAKNEVAGWPVFGFLSRLQQTAFISRSRSDAQKEKNALSNMLAEGKSLILFPEGTSTDGTDVAPFKSSLFSMTLDGSRQDLMIQPVTLRLEQVGGKAPDDPALRDQYAWYGDMTMPPHLKNIAAGRGAVVRLIFHPPLDPKAFSDRKSISDRCWEAVRSGLQRPAVASGLAA